jgi:hypothetical protein
MSEVKSREQLLEEDLMKQLADFKADNSILPEYERFNPRSERVLVQVFKFVPSDSSVIMGNSPILTVSPLDGRLKPSTISKHEKIFPIVKVLKKGAFSPEWVEDGALYIVPYNDVVGETWNPDFQFMMQSFSQKKGDGKPGMVTIPDDMEQKLQKIEVNWERYKFSMPDRIGKETDTDKLVYLIPSLKLEADYLV